jgi:hypothetical protein
VLIIPEAGAYIFITPKRLSIVSELLNLLPNAFYVLIMLIWGGDVFGQNDLKYYITAAQQNSPLIQDNKNLSEVNKIEIDRLKAFYTKAQITFNASVAVSPVVNYDNGVSRIQINPSDPISYKGYDMAASNGGAYQGILNVNQPLFNNGKLKVVSEQIEILGKINQNTIKLNEHDIEKIVGDQYILCLQDLKQTEYIEQLVKIIEEQRAVIVKLVENGILKQSDLLLVSIEMQTQLSSLSLFKSNYRRDLMDLNILCGINDTSLVKLNRLEIQINLLDSVSNFAEKYRLDSLNLVASQRNLELRYKPQLNSFANAGFNGVYLPTMPNRFGVSAGLNLSIYIFDGKQKDLYRKKTEYLIHSTQAYKANFITQNSIRKNKLMAEINTLNERIILSENQLKDYKQLLEYYKKEVITGQQSITTYILTLKSLATLERDFILMQSNKQFLINNYNYWNW